MVALILLIIALATQFVIAIVKNNIQWTCVFCLELMWLTLWLQGIY